MRNFDKEFETAFKEVDEVLDSSAKDSVFLPPIKTFVDKEKEQAIGVIKSRKRGDSLDSAVMKSYMDNRKKAAEEAGVEYTGEGLEDSAENDQYYELQEEEEGVITSEIASVANEFWEDFEQRSRHEVRLKPDKGIEKLPPEFIFYEKSENLQETENVIERALKENDGPPVL